MKHVNETKELEFGSPDPPDSAQVLSAPLNRRRLLTVMGAVGVAMAVPEWAFATTPVPPEPAFPKGDAKRYGEALAKYADAYDSGWVDQYSKAKMILRDARGDSVEREITQKILEGSSGDKSMVRFMSPADIRGVAALIHEHPRSVDDSWLYLPASRRVRRISGANRTASFQGTEFTYEDLSRFNADRYSWRFLAETTVSGEPVYQLEAKPNYAETGYSRLVGYVHRKHWRQEKVEFFDLAGRKLKTLTQSRFKQLHGRYWRAHRMEMNNHQTGKSTTLDITALFLNLTLYPKRDGSPRASLSDGQFTKRALENG